MYVVMGESSFTDVPTPPMPFIKSDLGSQAVMATKDSPRSSHLEERSTRTIVFAPGPDFQSGVRKRFGQMTIQALV